MEIEVGVEAAPGPIVGTWPGNGEVGVGEGVGVGVGVGLGAAGAGAVDTVKVADGSPFPPALTAYISTS